MARRKSKSQSDTSRRIDYAKIFKLIERRGGIYWGNCVKGPADCEIRREITASFPEGDTERFIKNFRSTCKDNTRIDPAWFFHSLLMLPIMRDADPYRKHGETNCRMLPHDGSTLKKLLSLKKGLSWYEKYAPIKMGGDSIDTFDGKKAVSQALKCVEYDEHFIKSARLNGKPGTKSNWAYKQHALALTAYLVEKGMGSTMALATIVALTDCLIGKFEDAGNRVNELAKTISREAKVVSEWKLPSDKSLQKRNNSSKA